MKLYIYPCIYSSVENYINQKTIISYDYVVVA